MLNFISGRSNLAATIFVPYDCQNKCPFCNSKAMYKDLVPNWELLEHNIDLINRTQMIREVVLTGGEPFDNLELLGKIIDLISPTKRLFINTTLPTRRVTSSAILDFLYVYEERIDGLNVSRHMTVKTVDNDDDLLKLLPVPFRINSVLYGYKLDRLSQESEDNFLNFISQYKEADVICLRADYRKMTFETLKTVSDPVLAFLSSLPDVDYLGGGGCQVCNNDTFLVNGQKVSYHRGMEHSSIRFASTVVVNDIIVAPDGRMTYDWDETSLTDETCLRDLGLTD